MEVKDCIQTRQSCRSYFQKTVEREKLEYILSGARLAPSARNRQPWKMYVVTGEEKSKPVRAALQKDGFNAFLDNVTTYIAIVDQVNDENRFVRYDVGELTAYITLLAKDCGLETCIIGWIEKDQLKTALGYSENEDCNIVVALGYSDAPLRQKTRKTESETIVWL